MDKLADVFPDFPKNPDFMQKQLANETYSPVTVMVRLTVDSDFEAAVIEAQNQFAEAAAQFNGHIESESRKISSGQKGSTSFMAIHSFDSADHLIRWLESLHLTGGGALAIYRTLV